MSINASQGWSALASSSGSDILVGYAVTLSADARTMVVATDANLTASPSGMPAGVAFTGASAGQGFNVQSAGPIDAELVPFVGSGANVEFAIIDSLGRVTRSSTFTNRCIGLATKDGGVVIDLSAWGALIGGGGSSATTALVDGSPVAGDALTPVGNASDANRLIKATPTNLTGGLLPKGIALSAPVLGLVIYAGPGTTVSRTVTGLSAGTASWGVLDSNARVVRKDAPEASDVVIGSINTEGHLLIAPRRPANSEIVVTHPPFNAKNDGSADASDAIRAAIDASQKTLLINGSARPIRFPAGDYIINKPLHVKYAGSRIFGEGSHSTNFRSVTNAHPLFYVGPDRGEFPHVNNAFAGGAAIQLRKNGNPTLEHWLPLGRVGAGHWFHGASQFEARFIIQIVNTVQTDTTFIIASYGRRFSDEGAGGGYAEAWGIGYAGSAAAPRTSTIFMTLTTTSGILSTFGNNGALTADGAYHEVICNWSSGQMRIFIDGVQQTLSNSGALAGTIIQNSYESVIFGGGVQRFYGSREVAQTDCNIASFSLEAAVSRTSGYTPSGTKFATTANTKLFCNFDTYDGVFIVGQTRPATNVSSLVTAYWPHRNDEVAVLQMPDCETHDFYVTNLYGPAVECEAATRFGARNLETLSKYGLIADNNCYVSSFENIKLVSSGSAALPVAGIHCVSAANVMSFRDLVTQGYDYHMVTVGASDWTLMGYWYPAGAALLYLYCATTFSASLIGDISMSDESASAAPVAFIGLLSVDSFIFKGGVMGQSLASSGPLVHVQGDSGFGPTNINIEGYLSPHSSSPGHVKVIGTTTGLIKLDGHKNNSVVLVTSGSNANARVIWIPYTYRTLAIAMPDSNRTITREEHLNGSLEFTGTLTAQRDVTFPAIPQIGSRSVYNGTNQNLRFLMSGGGIAWTVAAGAGATFRTNGAGTELVKV